MYFNKISFFLFLSISIIIIFLGYVFTPEPVTNYNYRVLDAKDFWVILLANTVHIFLLLIISFTGVSIILLFKYIVEMGVAGQESGISPDIYYSSSFIHGLLEIMLLYIVFIASLIHLKYLYGFIKTKNDINLKQSYIYFLKKVLPILIVILIISALAEVYISNRILGYLI